VTKSTAELTPAARQEQVKARRMKNEGERLDKDFSDPAQNLELPKAN
jgi:hypothetical protein